MAESNLSITYNTLAREVGSFMGWGRDRSTWDNTQKQDFDDMVARGLRLFYYPPTSDDQPYYEWSFLRKTGTITLVTNTSAYDLPDDFGGTILDSSLSYARGQGLRAPHKVPEQDIRQMQAFEDSIGTPKYYAVRNKAHNDVNGQRYEFLVYPTPDSVANTKVITFRYVYVPDTINNTNTYPVGGAQYSEVILAAVLSAAEYKNDDDPNGPYTQKFQQLLSVAMRNDMQQKENDRGGDR